MKQFRGVQWRRMEAETLYNEKFCNFFVYFVFKLQDLCLDLFVARVWRPYIPNTYWSGGFATIVFSLSKPLWASKLKHSIHIDTLYQTITANWERRNICVPDDVSSLRSHRRYKSGVFPNVHLWQKAVMYSMVYVYTVSLCIGKSAGYTFLNSKTKNTDILTCRAYLDFKILR